MSSFDHLRIPLIDIQTATNNFADENLIKQGGFGRIYKGRLLRYEKLIDIIARRLDYAYNMFGQGVKEFKTEIIMLSDLNHQNLVTIVGFCDENDEKIIVNKFEANASLDQYLSDPILTWTQRLHVCLDIARALSYIHYDEGRNFSVIHRDIKSSKILLDDKWEAKLSGFGLSTKQPAVQRHGLVIDRVCGMIGYADPAYVQSSTVTHKSDVYSFGVVLFEVLSGRKAFIPDINGVLLAKLAKIHYENGTLDEIIHPCFQNQIDSEALKIFSEAAYCCLNDQRAQRPSINKVIYALEQALKLQLACENLLVLTERSVEATSTDHWKGKDFEHLKIGFDEIKLATENFAKKYCIGTGGYGAVYKAELKHFDPSVVNDKKQLELPSTRSIVAIKKIFDRQDKEGEQGFIVEIETLSSCVHPNIVSLLGFCHEPPHMILVYEYLSNGSLDDYLDSQGKMTNLTWVQRLKICIDIARGLDYIHTTMDNKPKIIHCDIKSANILLDENWKAKIADFGLSRFHPLNHTKSTIITNKVVGTKVYWDPEYEKTGKLKKESDVYSFGVVLFEILCGRLAYDPVYTNENEKGLAPIVREHFKKGTIREMIDPNLKEQSTFTLSKGPNQDSLNTFSIIGYKCLVEKQSERPTMEVVVKELQKALNFEETHENNLRISFEDIRLATQNFSNQIAEGEFGKIYKGEVLNANIRTPIAVRRDDERCGLEEKEFMTELQILFEYKHENIIGLIGYCNENNEKILVYEYASKGSLDTHLKDASLTWTQRLKIGIDVSIGLDFLHGSCSPVIHRNIKSTNILLNEDWTTKITDFGLSMITPLKNDTDYLADKAFGTTGYADPHCYTSCLTNKSDVYSLGVVLLEMMCERLVILQDHEDMRGSNLVDLVKRYYNIKKLDELVFEGIKDRIMPKSLTTYQRIAYECLHDDREKRPTVSEVVLQLKKALEFQEDAEIWESKLPIDYKKIIIQMSQTPEIYLNQSKKELYEMFSKGILLQKNKVCFSLDSNGERNEMVSSTTFSYGNHTSNKRRYIKNSRFKRVVKMMDLKNLKIQIEIVTQFLTPNVIYGAYLVFKFCDPSKISSKLMYVNLKYQMGSETLHSYFATCEDDEWMTIELCRFIPYKRNVYFKFLIESLSRYYCGSGDIYVEGIHFRAINDATLKVNQPQVYEKLKGIQRVMKSNSDSMQEVRVDYHEISQLHDGEEVLENELFRSLGTHLPNMYRMLPAKMILDESSMKCFKCISVSKSRFEF